MIVKIHKRDNPIDKMALDIHVDLDGNIAYNILLHLELERFAVLIDYFLLVIINRQVPDDTDQLFG